jgi:hypothetical protein
VIAAGGSVGFTHFDWSGGYWLHRINVYDGAREFHWGMYKGGLHCLSFHWHKHLPIGRGGMILTDSVKEWAYLRKMRYDGRTPGVPEGEMILTIPSWHVYMIPEDAARGLMLMGNVKDEYEDLPWTIYPEPGGYRDLSKVDWGKHAV